jgi:N utilization substance protein A
VRRQSRLLAFAGESGAPEVYEGIVEIKAASREPGSRAKIAVYSTDPDVDPVGACVGMKGTRVQAVVQELRGERVDIVSWTPDAAEYVCRALQPAKVSKIILDEDEHAMEVVVPDDQLSLAIGKKGQNVRLAARLTGWKLDVRSEAEVEVEHTRALAQLITVPGISNMTAELLYQNGFKSVEDVAATDLEALLEVEGLGPEKAATVLQAVREYTEAQANADQLQSEGARDEEMSEEVDPSDTLQELA